MAYLLHEGARRAARHRDHGVVVGVEGESVRLVEVGVIVHGERVYLTGAVHFRSEFLFLVIFFFSLS